MFFGEKDDVMIHVNTIESMTSGFEGTPFPFAWVYVYYLPILQASISKMTALARWKRVCINCMHGICIKVYVYIAKSHSHKTSLYID